MNTLYRLDDVVAELENSVNINRIKKLLYFVAYGKWEGDQKRLDRIQIEKIISEILELSYNLDDLDNLLKDICSKINKQVEYLAVSQQIIQNIAPLYETEISEDVSRISENASRSTAFLKTSSPELLVSENNHQINPQMSDDSELAKQLNNNLFEVRLKLVQQTNPLRVKILIFSALHTMFNFSERDWSALKQHRLDRLLKSLWMNCPSKKELENRLYKTAKKFERKNETIQVASAIVKYLSPLYSDDSQPSINHQVNQEFASSSPGNSVYEPTAVNGNSLNQINQANQSNHGAIASQNHQLNNGQLNNGQLNNGVTSPQNPMNNSSIPGDEPENFPDYQYLGHLGQIYASSDDVTIPELHTSVSEVFSEVGQISENSDDRTVTTDETIQPVVPAKIPAKKGLKITESLKIKLGLEEEIKGLVNSQVARLMEEIETSLSQLENLLDEQLLQSDAALAASLKYNSLKDMISQVQGNASKYLDILNQMQLAEIQQQEPSTQVQAIAPPTTQNYQQKSADELQAKVMELAKQGNAKAIAAMMNQTLKGRGINTLATIKNYCLHIVLESEQEPNQQASINVVRKNVMPLELSSITKVKVHWRQSGSKSPVWSHEFSYHWD